MPLHDYTGLMGLYFHGNEQYRHIPFLYNYVNQLWKSQAMVRKIQMALYRLVPAGLCGMDDYCDRKILLPSIAANEFLFPNFPHSKISFIKANNGQEINQLKWHLSDFVFPEKKIILKPFYKSQINLKEFAGKYYSAELGAKYNFLVKDNNLVATHNRNDDIKMQGLQPDVFISNQGYFRKVEFIRNGQSQIIGCKTSAKGIKEIKFEKNNCYTF